MGWCDRNQYFCWCTPTHIGGDVDYRVTADLGRVGLEKVADPVDHGVNDSTDDGCELVDPEEWRSITPTSEGTWKCRPVVQSPQLDTKKLWDDVSILRTVVGSPCLQPPRTAPSRTGRQTLAARYFQSTSSGWGETLMSSGLSLFRRFSVDSTAVGRYGVDVKALRPDNIAAV